MKLLIFKLPFILIFFTRCFASYPIFLEHEINSAIENRDDFYKEIQATELLFPYDTSDSIASQILNRLNVYDDKHTLWYYFLSGLGYISSNSDSASIYFFKALNSTENDIAKTWVLSNEFQRCHRLYWEIRCLEKIQYLMLSSGGITAQTISQPLYQKAVSEEKKANYNVATTYYSWVHEFDYMSPLSWIREMRHGSLFHPFKMYTPLVTICRTIKSEWPLQLSIALYMTIIFKNFIIFLLIGISLLLAFIHVPGAFHGIIEKIPINISQKTKLYLCIIVLLSVIAIGIIPFIWLLILFLWKYCKGRDKWLLRIECLLLVLYPLIIRMEDMVRRNYSPQSSPMLYLKTLNEGYDSELEKIIRKRAIADKNDYLAYMAAAISAIKNNELVSAGAAIQRAEYLNNKDPAVLLTKGIILYNTGNYYEAESVFKTGCSLYPEYPEVFFNAGQSCLASNKTISGMEYVNKAAKLSPEVNAFIAINDRLFSKNWPILRQLMPPKYQSKYYWKNVFPEYCGSWNTANELWGFSFIGLNIRLYIILSIITILGLFSADRFFWNSSQPEGFVCRLCGVSMCRKCKKGMICLKCFNAVNQIRNESIRQRIIEKILLKNRLVKNIKANIIDIIFPGCGMLYRNHDKTMHGLVLLVVSSALYPLFLTMVSVSKSYSYMAIEDIMRPIIIVLPLYSVFFLIRALVNIRKNLVDGGMYGA
jgi:tetratricopeptide (TPR) repeat protein